jgi:ribosomal protein S7
VPVEVNPNRRHLAQHPLDLSLRPPRAGDGKTMQEKLANELLEPGQTCAAAPSKKREDTHRNGRSEQGLCALSL